MNTETKAFLKFFAAAVVGGLISGGVVSYYIPAGKTVVQQVAVGSATGSTFNTAKVAMIVASLASATSTSVFNGDASDRIVVSFSRSCTGIGTSQTPFTGTGLASLTIQASTSTSPASSSFLASNTNYVINTVQSTSSGEFYDASTTPGLTSSAFVRRWAAGTYLDIFTNATNTASCVVGVNYLAS